MLFTSGASGGFRRSVKRRHRNGELISLTPTCFIETIAWKNAMPSQRFMAKAIAVGTFHKNTVLTGRGAAALRGFPILDYSPAFQLLRSSNSSSPLPGVQIKRAPSVVLERAETIEAEVENRSIDVVVTDTATTIAYLALFDSVEASVVAADHCLHNLILSTDHLATTFSALKNKMNRLRLDQVLTSVSRYSESPRETLVRLALIKHGITGFHVQPTIVLTETGRRIRPDFVFFDWMVVVEYDGSGKYENADPSYLVSEIDRQHEISNAGFTIVRIRKQHFKNGTWLRMIKAALRYRDQSLPDTFYVEDSGESF